MTNIQKRLALLNASRRESLTCGELPTAKELTPTLSSVISIVTQNSRYRCRVTNDGDFVAFTDGHTVTINRTNQLTESMSEPSGKMLSLIGFAVHEAAHICYTNFSVAENWRGCLQRGVWYPSAPHGSEIPPEVLASPLFINLSHMLQNVIEDAHIELRIRKRFGGTYIEALDACRTLSYYEAGSVEDSARNLAAGESNPINVLIACYAQLLIFARHGVIKRDGTLLDENEEIISEQILNLVDLCKGTVAEAVVQPGFLGRISAVNKCMALIWPWLRDLFSKPDSPTSTSGDDTGESSSAPSSGSEDSGKSSSTPSSKDEKCSGHPAGHASKTIAEKTAEAMESIREITEEDLAELAAALMSESGIEDKDYPSVDSPPLMDGDMLPDGEENPSPGTYMEDIASDLAKSELDKELSKEASPDLTDLTPFQGVKPGFSINYKMNNSRLTPDETKYRYNLVLDDVKPAGDALYRNISRILKERRISGKINGLPMGRSLSTQTLYRDDGLVWQRKTLPTGNPDVAVAILVDLSGSMGGERINTARNCAIAIEYGFSRLSLPMYVAGHCADRGVCKMQVYRDFDVLNSSEHYNLALIEAGGDNLDGFALEYVSQQIAKRPEQRKIIIVISDGLPLCGSLYDEAGRVYCGSHGAAHTRDVVGKLSRKKIQTIAFAIGSDMEQTADIYGRNNTICIDNLNELSPALSRLLSHNVLEN